MLETQRPLFFDPYRENRVTGSFILIDPITNATLAAGMILGEALDEIPRDKVADEERWRRNGHKPYIIAMPDNPDLADAVERALFDRGCQVAVVEDRPSAEALAHAGFIAICTACDQNAPPFGTTVDEVLSALRVRQLLSND